jgi:hypothetical protein
MSDLGEYLKRATRTPWVWGQHDCCSFIADWSIECGHPDPMQFMRGRYRTERGALLAIRRNRGLVVLVEHGMKSAGIPKVTDDLRPGDVGVIEVETEDRTNRACAIWTGERWASLGLRGLICRPADALAVWRP